MRNDLGGSGRGLPELLSRHLPGRTEDYHEELQAGKLAPRPRFRPIITSRRRIPTVTAMPTCFIYAACRVVARQRPRNNHYTTAIALKTTAVARQWLSSDHAVTPTNMNATTALREACCLPDTPHQDDSSWLWFVASAALSCTGLPRHRRRNVCAPLEAQLTTNTKSVSSGS
jgi:hypothetical protein